MSGCRIEVLSCTSSSHGARPHHLGERLNVEPDTSMRNGEKGDIRSRFLPFNSKINFDTSFASVQCMARKWNYFNFIPCSAATSPAGCETTDVRDKLRPHA
jgi:hypothetical protein